MKTSHNLLIWDEMNISFSGLLQGARQLKLTQLLLLHSRAISVILGDKWKKMKSEERRMYTMEAKALAEEQKRLNPDCWKRKRSNSVRTKKTVVLSC